MPFRKLAGNKAGRYSLDSKLEKWADHSCLSEDTDIASFLNAFAKSAETEMHHSLSVYS